VAISEKIEFLASFPPIQSAIKITGNRDGMRIILDIPETEIGEAARLILMRESAFKVTIEEIESQPINGNRAISRSTAKKRK
jgi:hypothetical protein